MESILTSALARTLLKDTPILILDEATSVMYTESERYIQAALINRYAESHHFSLCVPFIDH